MSGTPKNIAIIMDGNRRWSKLRQKPIINGYKQGVLSLKKIIKECVAYNISQLTVFAFSSENWRRSNYEVNLLMGLLEWYIKSEIAEIHQNNILFKVIGRKDRFSPKLVNLINSGINLTKYNTGLNLNIALDYGGRDDIIFAAKKIALDVRDKKLNVNYINEELFHKYLLSSEVDDIDLLIRTSGEKRISNFMLWQLNYSEIYYSNLFWPDFGVVEFHKSLNSYKKRERRFGVSVNEI